MNRYEWTWTRVLDKAVELGPDPDLAGVADEVVEQRVRTGAAEIAALTCQWLGWLAEFVIRGGWDGYRSPAEWLSHAVGMAPNTARDHVRVALRLRELPAMRTAFAAGRISYSKVRALTRCATPEIEPMLLQWADASTASQLETIISSWVRTGRTDPVTARADRAYTERWVDQETVEIRLQVPVADAAAFREQLDRLVELADRADDADDAEGGGHPSLADDQIDDPAGEVVGAGIVDGEAIVEPPRRRDVPLAARRVDAVLAAVAQAVADGPADTTGADEHLVVLYAPADSLVADTSAESDTDADRDSAAPPSAPSGRARRATVVTGRGRNLAMSPTVLRRLACDAAIRVCVTDADGSPLDLGRKTRTVTAAQKRALLLRDRHCQFPGCRTRRHLHAHHVIHWADGGETDLANLVLVCSFHHRYVHDHDWHATPIPGWPGRFAFHPPRTDEPIPDGRRLPGASAESVRQRLIDDLGRTPAPDDLLPANMIDTYYDLDACVAGITDELDRLAVQPALAA